MLFFSVVVVSTVLIALRRPDQVQFPEVWNEDGQFIIPQIIQGGFLAVFDPVNGYLIIPSRLITWISLLFSFERYPAISTAIGAVMQAFCIAAIAVSPTFLRWRPLCALGLIFLPMDAEVYLLPQYTFWWSTLLLFLGLLWLPERSPTVRSIFVLVGGFSSPMVVLLTPIFGLRLLYTRAFSTDGIALVIAAMVAAVQIFFIFLGDPAQTSPVSLLSFVHAIRVFFGSSTIIGDPLLQYVIGATVLAILLSGILAFRGQERVAYFGLMAVLGACVASSLARVPVEIISPTGGGPRYFFLPFVVISWGLIWLSAKYRVYSAIVVLLVIMSAPVTFQYFQRHQERMVSWSDAVKQCLYAGANMPVHYTGELIYQHHIPYAKELCQAATRQSILDR